MWQGSGGIQVWGKGLALGSGTWPHKGPGVGFFGAACAALLEPPKCCAVSEVKQFATATLGGVHLVFV